jgi:hypothetical protein
MFAISIDQKKTFYCLIRVMNSLMNKILFLKSFID